MKSKSSGRLSEADAYYLPGLFGDDEISTPPASSDGGAPLPTKSKGYWVRQSAKQQVDTFRRPAGFRYELMLGARVVHSGTGGASRRSVLATATFLNSKQPRPHQDANHSRLACPHGAAAAANGGLCNLARLPASR